MDIKELLPTACIVFDSNAQSRCEVFAVLTKALKESGFVEDENEYIQSLKYRESLSETGLCSGIAIPHGKSKTVIKSGIAFMKLKEPIKEWPSLDHLPIDTVIQLAIPGNSQDVHIRLLSQLARKLAHKEVIDALKKAKTVEDVYKALS